ncbi:MAG: ABC transporter transmembrane domain-containing protein, partial [Thermodesulfovibrionales bacterium]
MALLKKIILLVKPYWLRLAASALLSLLISGLNGGLAWLVKPALDGIFLRRDADLLALLPLGILALYLARGFFAFFQSYLMRSTGAKVMRDIRNGLYRHLLSLPVNEFKKESSGVLLSRVINDAGQLQGLVAFSIKDIFVESATVLVLLAVAFYRRWDLALISVTVLPAALYGTRRLGKRLKKVSTEGQKKISRITEFLTETFSGIKMVKIFGREEVLAAAFREKNQGYYRELMRSTRIIEFTSLMMEV